MSRVCRQLIHRVGGRRGPGRFPASRRACRAALLATLIAVQAVWSSEIASAAGPNPSAVQAASTVVPGSTYHALTPARIFDAATGAGGATPLISGTAESFQVAGGFGVPVGATAVAGTLSITKATRGGFVSLAPVSETPASIATSTINFGANDPRSVGVTATLGDDGKLWALYESGVAGRTALPAFDLEGYYAPDDDGATYHAVGPVRVFDSRTAFGGAAPLAADVPEPFQLTGAFDIPAGATAVTGTMTIVGAARPGRVALTPDATAGASLATTTLSFATVDARATGVTATLGQDGRFWAVYETGHAGDKAQFIFDLTGYFTPDRTGSTFHRLGPLRLIDSRSGVGASARLSSEAPRSFQIVGLYGIPASTTAVSGNLTVVNPTRSGYVALTAVSTSRTAISTSSINFPKTGAHAAGVTVPLGTDGKLWAIYGTGRVGNTADVIFDLSGYFAPDSGDLTPLPAGSANCRPYDSSPRDSDGAVMVDYGSSGGLQHNPVTISQAAISYFDCWRSGGGTAEQADADRASFFAQANWLLANQQPDGRWLYTFKWGAQPLPWWSAMAEGQGMSALLRAYSVTSDGAYLAALVRARSTFDRTIADLGVGRLVTVSGRHLTVYQEYLPGYVDNVLNGWISALGGLYECAIYLGDPIALHDLAAADRGLSALRALLPYYDTGSWSFYGLNTLVGQNRGPRASSAYHNLHIRQLRWLYSITGYPVMKKYADRFQSYVTGSAVNGGTFDPGQPDPGFPVDE